MRWLDFVLDEKFGPLLALPMESPGVDQIVVTSRLLSSTQKVRTAEERVQGVRKTQLMGNQIQETGQGQRPARMVGQPNLDSTTAQKTMDGELVNSPLSARLGGEG
jgi:hypothetical protein